MKNVYQSTHIATSPKTKQQLRKFKEECIMEKNGVLTENNIMIV